MASSWGSWSPADPPPHASNLASAGLKSTILKCEPLLLLLLFIDSHYCHNKIQSNIQVLQILTPEDVAFHIHLDLPGLLVPHKV